MGLYTSGSGGSSHPPKATITIDDKELSYQKGSYCWSDSGQGVCADTVGAEDLTKDVEPLVVNKNGSINISYEEQPSELFVRMLKNGNEVQKMQDKYEVKVPSEAGTYVYNVFARWKDKGDASLAFKITVQE